MARRHWQRHALANSNRPPANSFEFLELFENTAYKLVDRIDLMLIDELGYIPFDREATDLLFQLISQRYERRSIALTTNLPFEKWTQIFPDEMTATAVIDRLVHHGSVFAFSGQSHRLRTRGKSSKNS